MRSKKTPLPVVQYCDIARSRGARLVQKCDDARERVNYIYRGFCISVELAQASVVLELVQRMNE